MRILCGSPISENKDVFKEHIKSLLSQGLPMDYKGIDNSPIPLEKPEGFLSVEWRREQGLGEYKNKRVRWNDERLGLLGRLREEIRVSALHGDYDYLFMVDSDIILGKDTLKILLDAKKDFIAGLMWTKHKRNRRRKCWPNVWELGEKQHIKWDEKFLRKMDDIAIQGGVHQVGLTGACSLLSRHAIRSLSYSPIGGISGEDTWLAIRARDANIPLFISADVSIEHRGR